MMETFTLKHSSGNELIGDVYSVENPSAVVALIHGQGEHFGRYAHVARFLNDKNIALIGIDLIGHGRSGGKKGHIRNFADYHDCVDRLLAECKSRFSNIPVFLYGHSMGGNIVTSYALKKNPDIKGLIVSAPWFKLAFDPPGFKVVLAKIAVNVVPSFTEPNGLNTTDLSHDTEVVKSYENDPLVHDKISAKAFLECFKEGLWILDHGKDLTVKTLLMHGSQDKITSCKASSDLSKQNPDYIQYVEFTDFFHEIHNELEKQKVLDTVLNFINQN